ncbi:hypothetical protein GCM10008936_05530 [Alkalibacterium indicireducens]|uniref:Uncharacterized protein n=1 Tax=Alkalibacterium indicireducens TaxID=398758 RepID=A0ABN1AJI5_9LACT
MTKFPLAKKKNSSVFETPTNEKTLNNLPAKDQSKKIHSILAKEVTIIDFCTQ